MNLTHGALRHKGKGTMTYMSYLAMRGRCLTKSHHAFKHYGGRGIKICARWLKSYEDFLKDMGERPDGYTLGRKNNERGYSKNNCKWETMRDQVNNTRSNVFISHNGERKTIGQWATISGLTITTFWKRLHRGWDMQKALTEPRRITSLSNSH